MNSSMTLAVVVLVAGVMAGLEVAGLELLPTAVTKTQEQTKAPSMYVQTLYKNTENQVVKNTLYPLWPSKEVLYAETQTTTLITQTIPTYTQEFQTVLNSTVLNDTGLLASRTWDVAATTYQTSEYQYQSVLYTDPANASATVTELDHNMLPFV